MFIRRQKRKKCIKMSDTCKAKIQRKRDKFRCLFKKKQCLHSPQVYIEHFLPKEKRKVYCSLYLHGSVETYALSLWKTSYLINTTIFIMETLCCFPFERIKSHWLYINSLKISRNNEENQPYVILSWCLSLKSCPALPCQLLQNRFFQETVLAFAFQM